MLNQKIVLEVNKIKNNQKELVVLMNSLDEEKRTIRSFMRQYSNEPKEGKGLVGSGRYMKLRSLKDKLSYLIEEREYVKQALGQLKENTKKANTITCSTKPEFSKAFMIAAEKVLSQEVFIEIEKVAGELLINKS